MKLRKWELKFMIDVIKGKVGLVKTRRGYQWKNNTKEMTYQEAIEKSFSTKWKVGTCHQGEQCWCRTIEPIEPILYKDGDVEDSYYIVGSGEMLRETAEYFVKLHNETFNIKEK